MKILFVCGCLEPGADGVGDYIRSLGAALAAQGTSVRMLALHDGAITDAVEDDADGFAWLRLPQSWPWERRLVRAEGWVSAFVPDWVSLQLVVFGFDARGLPFKLGPRLARLCVGRKVHLMFHEIAMGFNLQAPSRHRFYGWLQRRILRDIAVKTRPVSIHTTTPFYQQWLAGLGIIAKLLPLHGNVPVSGNRDEGRRWLLARLGLDESPYWLAGFFGGFSPTLDPARVQVWLERHPWRGRGLVVLTAGRIPSGAECHWKKIERAAAGAGRTLRLGVLSPDEVSRYLHGLDEGLTSYPGELLGKSGAVAAMRAHGLNVTALGALGVRSNSFCEHMEGPATMPEDTARRLLASLGDERNAKA